MADFDGGPGDDTYIGDGTNETINGNAGNDRLSGGGGADVVNGGDGDDHLSSYLPDANFYYPGTFPAPISLDIYAERDTLIGGIGNDMIAAGFGDNVDGGAGADGLYLNLMGATSGVTVNFQSLQSGGSVTIGGGTITGIEQTVSIIGSNFDDDITSYTGTYLWSDAIYGYGGNDHLTGDYYTQIIDGGTGNDVLDARASNFLSAIYGGDGDDTLYTNPNGLGATAYGGDGNDTLYTAGTTYGGNGNDTIYLQATYYTGKVYGEAGDDVIYGVASPNGYGSSISGGDGADTLIGSDNADVLASGNFGNDYLNPTPDVGTEHDHLEGRGGNDLIAIGFGDDADGGTGTNTLFLALTGSPSALTVDGNAILAGTASFGGGTITNIQRIARIDGTNFNDVIIMPTQPIAAEAHGGTGNDTITAGASAVTLYGDAGNDTLTGSTVADTLYGGDGDDLLDGGTGGDAMYGGIGNDTYIVDDSGDRVYENPGEGTDTVKSSSSYGLVDAPNVEQLVLTGTANINGTGWTGNDTIIGNSGNNTIAGGDGNDTLDGGAGVDGLYGQGGDDTIIVSGVGDVAPGEMIDGGAGTNTLLIRALNTDLSNATIAAIQVLSSWGGYTLSLTAAELSGFQTLKVSDLILVNGGTISLAGISYTPDFPSTRTIKLANADTVFNATGVITSDPNIGVNVNGGTGNDTITGTALNDKLDGGAGNDTLNGGAGQDSLTGGAGLDIIHGGAGYDTIIINEGDLVAGEVYDGGADSARLIVNASSQIDLSTVTLTSIDWLTGGRELLTAAQLAQFGSITGGNLTLKDGGAVTLNAQTDYAVITTINLAPVDTVFTAHRFPPFAPAMGGALYVNGSSGNDTINGTDNIDHLSGGDGNDTLYGYGGYDTLTGGNGNDILDGGSGDDIMVGGSGDDTYYIDTANDSVQENPGEGYDTEYSTVTFTLADNVERGILTSTGGAQVFGNGGDNWLIGNSGQDYLYGQAGNDRLDGGAGADQLFGGTGDDTFIVDNAGDQVIENAGEGFDTVLAGVSYTLSATAEVEKLATIDASATTAINLIGNAFSHDIEGNAGANELTGGSGADTLYGFAGNDRLFNMGAGDTLIGGAGDDIYVISDSSTVVVESAGEGNDTIKASVSYTLGAGVEVETVRLTGTADLTLTGNTGYQILIGNAGSNWIDDGGGGADRMKGAEGSDVYVVHNSGDTIVEVAGNGNWDTVLSYVDYALGADVYVERLAAADSALATGLTLTGNDHTLLIQGGGGADHLTGGGGNETLMGYAGDDVLTGGGAADTFVFDHDTGHDTVTDFASGADKLDLSAFGFANFAAVQAASHDQGGSAVIDLGSGDTVTLTGVTTAQLQSGDVILSSGSNSQVQPSAAAAHTEVAHQEVVSSVADAGASFAATIAGLHHIEAFGPLALPLTMMA